jgi:hypothetical protein
VSPITERVEQRAELLDRETNPTLAAFRWFRGFGGSRFLPAAGSTRLALRVIAGATREQQSQCEAHREQTADSHGKDLGNKEGSYYNFRLKIQRGKDLCL